MLRRFALRVFAVAGAFGIMGSLAFAHHAARGEREAVASTRPVSSARAAPSSNATVPARLTRSTATPALDATPAADATFAALPLVRFTNQNTRESADIRLYDATGHVDERAAGRLDTLLCDTRDPKAWATTTLDRRTLQLAVRAALHFKATEVQVVSAYRKPGRRREGPHANGKAIDFKLPGVPSVALAAYLRTLPRVGVGIYTHPKTAFVHLDDREHSFHWLDASPPGRTWRERSIGNAAMPKRDAAYCRADDWPEGTTPPEDALK